MNCFTIESNDKIESFLKEFNERIKHYYPLAFENYKKSKPINVSGWPTPKFDLVNVTYEEGYDYYHPLNWNKEIINQEGEITIQGKKHEFTFGGHNNIIDHFRMPIGFHKTFQFENIRVQNELKEIFVRNTHGIKRFKSLLKKDYKEYLKHLNVKDIFIRMIDQKSYIAIKELESNKYLAFNTKYRAVILNYKRPDIYKKPNSGFSELTDKSEIKELQININEILRNNMSTKEILKLEQRNTSM